MLTYSFTKQFTERPNDQQLRNGKSIICNEKLNASIMVSVGCKFILEKSARYKKYALLFLLAILTHCETMAIFLCKIITCLPSFFNQIGLTYTQKQT